MPIAVFLAFSPIVGLKGQSQFSESHVLRPFVTDLRTPSILNLRWEFHLYMANWNFVTTAFCPRFIGHCQSHEYHFDTLVLIPSMAKNQLPSTCSSFRSTHTHTYGNARTFHKQLCIWIVPNWGQFSYCHHIIVWQLQSMKGDFFNITKHSDLKECNS